ncbi:GNAT family N-acetyltransferase [Bacillus sp. SORGH_AS_0510]|uniref:GNAT family N-acetyltransferase n=1 Tax=Bacillus sp. SORGH_AS_0510 TaxID=3041771 RepID=UPI0027D80683|nr:GNAT family N-acetyltransferase [Bacillus sp. SORGH_AS_0510]
MAKEVVIKEYSRKYQEEVLELILNIQQKEYGVAITKEDQPDLLKIEEFYQTGNGNFWVALSGDRVVGTIALLDIKNGQTALRKMFVAKEFRGKVNQTASLLLNKLFDWGNVKAVTEIFLGTTPQFLAAHRFYEKNGFQEINSTELPESFPILAVDKKFYRYSS